MKKKTLIAVVTLALFLASIYLLTFSSSADESSKWDGTYPNVQLSATFGGGSGTQNDPYLIASAQDLAQFAANVNAFDSEGNYIGTDYDGIFFKLTTDIDLDGKLWTPIGGGNDTNGEPLNYFSGNFDGNFHTISNLKVQPEAGKDVHVGFFGYILRKTGTPGLSNLGIESGSVTGSTRVGGMVGRIKGTMVIDNCYNKADVFVDSTQNPLTGWSAAAGFVGQSDGTASYMDCYNAGDVTITYISATTAAIGGFVGYTTTGSGPAFTRCWNLGDITFVSCVEGATAEIGGFAGYLKVGSNVLYCNNTGSVTTSVYNGGYVGSFIGHVGSTGTLIDYCQSTASLNVSGLSADRFIGGANAETFTAASGNNAISDKEDMVLPQPSPDYHFCYIPDDMLEQETSDNQSESDTTSPDTTAAATTSTAATTAAVVTSESTSSIDTPAETQEESTQNDGCQSVVGGVFLIFSGCGVAMLLINKKYEKK